MTKHIQDPKTGKMAGSIGAGKSKIPTSSPEPPVGPKRVTREENPFFVDKPSWFPGYANTIANYLVSWDRVIVNPNRFELKDGPLLEHFKADNCKIGRINDLSENVEMESTFDTFGGKDYPVCYTSADVDCACGKIKRYRLSGNSTIDEVLSGAFSWEKQEKEQLQANKKAQNG